MEKYGVDETGEEMEKKAAAGCPKCGGKVEKHGNVLTCEHCGTEPFESGPSGQQIRPIAGCNVNSMKGLLK
jgi:ribosomal protein S27AE